jgi:hypothetical protein
MFGEKTYPWLYIWLFQYFREANDNAQDYSKQIGLEFGE